MNSGRSVGIGCLEARLILLETLRLSYHKYVDFESRYRVSSHVTCELLGHQERGRLAHTAEHVQIHGCTGIISWNCRNKFTGAVCAVETFPGTRVTEPCLQSSSLQKEIKTCKVQGYPERSLTRLDT